MEFRILGPVEVVRDGRRVPLGGARQRAVLARLLLDCPRVVPVERLVDDVWAGAPPRTAAKTLQKYVSELRKAVGPDVLTTLPGGYAMAVPADDVDAGRFERLVGAGDFAAALALWRGDVLADLDDLPFTVPERTRLHELRLIALEGRLQSDLDAGRHGEAAAELRDLVEEHPLRDGLAALLVLALYRSGRQVEALRAVERHRLRLAEIGVVPTKDLSDLAASVLTHDPGLERPAPPAGSGNLQPALSPFIGREDERQALLRSVAHERLVTLTGPGGAGKTRLATETLAGSAGAWKGGVWLVDLAPAGTSALVAHTVMSTLGLADHPGQDDVDTLVAALRTWPPAMLLLDSCEHVVDACAVLVQRLLRACPDVRVVATSTRPLGVDGELVLPVGALSESDAVALFRERARRSGATVPSPEEPDATVVEICRALDRLPLAIELAAGQLRVLGIDDITARLDERLQFPARRFDAPARQRSLRAVVEWSHELLDPPVGRTFAGLGVFATTFTADGARAVCGGEHVEHHLAVLVDHSLLGIEPGRTAPTRYRLLDTLRLFALERLIADGRLDEARRAHAVFHLGLARTVSAHLYGPDEQRWAGVLAAEDPNLHAALAWAATSDPGLGLELGIALWRYWEVRWRERFATAYLSGVLADERLDVDDGRRAWGLTVLADLASNPGEARQATGWATEAVDRFRVTGEAAGLAWALLALASACGNQGALDRADAALDEVAALAPDAGDPVLVGRLGDYRGFIATRRGEHERAEELSRDELRYWTSLGSRRGEATALRHVAVACRYTGKLDEAVDLCNRALALWQAAGDPVAAAHVRVTLADVARVRGDVDAAGALYEEALDELRSIGDRRCTASTLKNLGMLAAQRGDHDGSARLFLDALQLRHELGDEGGLAECLEGLAGALLAQDRAQEAAVLLGAANERRRVGGLALPHDELAAVQATVAAATSALGPDGFDPAYRCGERLGVDEVVQAALDGTLVNRMTVRLG